VHSICFLFFSFFLFFFGGAGDLTCFVHAEQSVYH
jgi:hypothetical protein